MKFQCYEDGRQDMEERFSKYDPTEYLTNEAGSMPHLDEAMTIGEPNFTLSAVLNDITKPKCMVKSCSENGNNNNACL
jgi:DNA-binding phage protein